MGQQVQVRLLGGFTIACGGTEYENLPQRSKKGAALMVYLILHRGKPVPTPRLIRELWGGRRSTNPGRRIPPARGRRRGTAPERRGR